MAQTTINHYIFVLCGGTGPRLWPLSRKSNPKQFLSFFGKDSLLEQTIKRAERVVDSKNIFIVSNDNYLQKIIKIAQKFGISKNIITEPERKNTALAILYATTKIKQFDPAAVITILPSDHYIKNVNKFKNDLIKARDIAYNHDGIVTIGIKPTSPNPAYGYIKPKNLVDNYYPVESFIEKPPVELATELIKNNSYWNSGIYTFSVNTLTNEFKELQPEYYLIYQELEKNLNQPQKIKSIYKQAPELAIDRAISEKSKKMIMIPASFDWSDVGEWNAIFATLSKKDGKNITLNSKTQILSTDSSNCLVSGTDKKLIGLVGVKNLAIIDTEDALLVCDLDSSFNVRDLVSLMVKHKKYKIYFLGNK